MQVALISANLGDFDPIVPPVPQAVPADVQVDVHLVTDAEFPPRRMAMTPRLQARIVKTCGWQMFPGYDAYVWLDASFSFQRADCLAWVLEHLTTDVATFAHPARQTIEQEADFIRAKVAAGNRYLVPRYAGELVEDQMSAIGSALWGLPLFATMLVAYRPTDGVREAMERWWWHISRYHSVDQLSFPFVMWQHGIAVSRLPGDPYACPYLTRTRTHHR